MGIFDEPAATPVKFSSLWKIIGIASVSLLAAQCMLLVTWGIWVTTSITEHASQLAVLKDRNSRGNAVSQYVNVGAADPAAAEIGSAKVWLTTKEVAAREKVTERTVINYIEQSMIDPPPVKNGKEWHIAENFRILPNGSENCGNKQ